MTRRNLPRLCISAGSSAAGKTTFCCGLLRALRLKGRRPAAFKCGPDYIDPMFHRAALGYHSGANLDLFLGDRPAVLRLLSENTLPPYDCAVLEGAMGYYDGLGGVHTEASAWDIACLTQTPAILIEDCRSLSVSLAARLCGLARFRPESHIHAVILNRLPEKRFQATRRLIEEETGLRVAGFLPSNTDWMIENRHLGLVTAAEIERLPEKLDGIAHAVETYCDLDLLESIARAAPPLPLPPAAGTMTAEQTVIVPPARIGVARDAAFCFYYEEGLHLLEQLGAELVPFSPLRSPFPAGLDGLLLGGGYPELHGEALAANTGLLRDLRGAVKAGLPCVAECGGFMYLHEALFDTEGRRWPLANVIPGVCRPSPRLIHFGYARYAAKQENLLCHAGEYLRGHEFHYWESDQPGADFSASKPYSGENGEHWDAIHADSSLFAGFPHFNFASSPGMARRFVEACVHYHQRRNDV